MWFAGFNGFGHFGTNDEALSTPWKAFQPPVFAEHRNPSEDALILSSTWSYNAYAVRNHLCIQGSVDGQLNHTKSFNFENLIKIISATDKACLVLLLNGELFKVCLQSCTTTKLNFIAIEDTNQSGHRSRAAHIFPGDEELGLTTSKPTAEIVTDIVSCETFSVALTSTNCLYTIPSKIYQFPKHERVTKMCGGAEHVLALTANGDVYAFGLSSRGQLGTGSTNSEELPALVDALAGIKIVDVACGAWHSAAVSAFGDLYVWGWNVNGQLGRAVYTNTKVTFSNGRTDTVRHKMPSVFAEPQVVELSKRDRIKGEEQLDGDHENLDGQYEVVRVYCGARHTVVKTGCGQLLVSGWNKYGQLAVGGTDQSDVTNFTKVNTPDGWKGDVVCGRWSTCLV